MASYSMAEYSYGTSDQDIARYRNRAGGKPPTGGELFKFSRQGIVAAPCGRLDKDGAGSRTTVEAREIGHTRGQRALRKQAVNNGNPERAKIIVRVYELWENAGMPEGRAEEFYHQAEQELRNEEEKLVRRTL